jgi:hypothetical protein
MSIGTFVKKRGTEMPYLERILKIVAEVKPGILNHVSVRHDNGCKIWKTGVCSCNPDVEIISTAEAIKMTCKSSKKRKRR